MEKMRNRTSITAIAAIAFGIAFPAAASANPFEDVPGNHWAYDAVAALAANGVIEGYGDGTYRGEQEITRYEMAQMVARAMAKNTAGADKALVDRLAAEFSDELNSLGVRVSTLEKKIDNVKWGGRVRYRYKNAKSDDRDRNTSQYVTLRFEPEIKINEHWTAMARMDYNTDMNTAKNSAGAPAARSGQSPMTSSSICRMNLFMTYRFSNSPIRART